MVALVFVQDVPAPAELFAHVGYFLSECSVLALEEGGAHRDLVLLQSAGIARTLRGLVVLATSTPVLVVLEETQKRENRKLMIKFTFENAVVYVRPDKTSSVSGSCVLLCEWMCTVVSCGVCIDAVAFTAVNDIPARNVFEPLEGLRFV